LSFCFFFREGTQGCGPPLPCRSTRSLYCRNSQTYGNKKRRGSNVSLRAYPQDQAFAMPPSKDKQRKACPRQMIYIHTTAKSRPYAIHKGSTPSSWHTPYYIYKDRVVAVGDIESTHADASCCITAVLGLKVAKFDLTDSNVKKTSFRDQPYNRLGGLIPSMLF